MLHFFKPRVSPALVLLLEDVGGGAHKRVDENRELLELLQSKAPFLLDQYPWIVGWLRANDEVFVEMGAMATALGLEPRFGVPGRSGVHRQTMAFRCHSPPGFAGFAPCLVPSHGHPALILNAFAPVALRASLASWGLPCGQSPPRRLGGP